jgi:uncharacterized membrane protein
MTNLPPDDVGGNPHLSEGIPPPLERVLREAGVNTHDPEVQRTVEVISVSSISARGTLPLPPPQLLAEYQEVVPDLPQRLINWTETQAAHRRRLEILKAEGQERRMNRGQWGALAVALGGLLIAGIVGVYGNGLASAFIALFAVGGPTTAVVLASNSSIGWLSAKKPRHHEVQ